MVQTLNFRNSDQYRSWETHIKGALTLLELRGQEQFSRERGGQLYTQIRSQIVSILSPAEYMDIDRATAVSLHAAELGRAKGACTGGTQLPDQ